MTKEIIHVPVTRKEFLQLPMSIRRRAIASQCDRLVAIKALDALGLALTKHNHKWTEKERELYESSVS